MDRSSTPAFGSAEELLKSQTVGLVHLSDFRKRRAEAIERTEGADKRTQGFVASGSNAGSGTTQWVSPVLFLLISILYK